SLAIACGPHLPSAAFRLVPMSAGLLATRMPAPSSAAILSVALPDPPEMMAPAWPIRLPGGAVWPAMEAAIGLVHIAHALTSPAPALRAAPRRSPHVMRPGGGPASPYTRPGPPTRVPRQRPPPPMPTQVLWPIPRQESCQTPSYVSVPDRLTTPTRPGLWIYP